MNALLEVFRMEEVKAERNLTGGCSARTCATDPLRHSGWPLLLSDHPEASFFHGRPWARVLPDPYGHKPIYFCSFADDQLQETLPVMEVNSPWTGRRGVSLPFTDFCPALQVGGDAQRDLFEMALAHGRKNRWRYLEVRGRGHPSPGATSSVGFYGHEIDLALGQEALFQGLDGAIRRGIRKAAESGLKVNFSNTIESIQTFYALHCRTRRRHGLPPQPFRLFENIAEHVLGLGYGFVATIRFNERPIASAVFLNNNRQAIYKFGASDYAFQHLRPNNLLMWEAIKRYAENGFSRLHLGRTSLFNEGLRRFKLGLGAREEKIDYYRYDFREDSFVTGVDRSEGWFNRVFRYMPRPLLRLAGELIY